MAKIPFQLRRKSIPGAEYQPRATADDFGAAIGRTSQRFAGQVSKFASDFVDKKFQEESDIYVSSVQSEARKKFTRRAIELRKEVGEDITGTLAFEYEAYRHTTLLDAPNDDAARRANIALDAISGTLTSNSIIGDEIARDKRVEFQSLQSHRDNLTTVYDDFGQLPIVMATEAAQISSLRLDPQTKIELTIERRMELGREALTGLVDRDRAGAEQVLRILNDPTHSELANLMGNPEEGIALEDLLDVKHRQKLEKYVDTTIESHDAEARAVRLDKENQRILAQRKIRNDLYVLFEKGTLTNELIAASGADADTKNHMRNLLIMREEGREDPGPAQAERYNAWVALVDVIEGTPTENIQRIDTLIDWHVAARLITPNQAVQLSQRLNQPVIKARNLLEKTLHNLITKTNNLTGLRDPVGDALYEAAIADINDAVEEATKDYREFEGHDFGRRASVYDLFDPRTEAGKKLRSRLYTNYVRSPAQITEDIARASGVGWDLDPKMENQAIIDSILEAVGSNE